MSLVGKMVISFVIVVVLAALAYLYFSIFVLKGSQQIVETQELSEEELANQVRRNEMNAPPLVEIDLNDERKTEIDGDLRDKQVGATSESDSSDNLRSSLTQ